MNPLLNSTRLQKELTPMLLTLFYKLEMAKKHYSDIKTGQGHNTIAELIYRPVTLRYTDVKILYKILAEEEEGCTEEILH